MTEPPSSERFDVLIHPRRLPAEAEAERGRRAEYEARLDEIVAPRIAANVTAIKLVCQRLEQLHATVADRTDLELLGPTRPSAMWLIAGRCLGLLHALVAQVEAGICGPAVPTARVLHEAAVLLQVVSDSGEDELLERWLDDPDDAYSYVKHGQALAALKRGEDRLEELAREKGLGGLGKRPSDLAPGLYDLLSRAGHNRRLWAVDDVDVQARQMSYGRHRFATRRAGYLSYAVAIAVEVTRHVGFALSALLGKTVWSDEIVPLLNSLEAVEQASPLDADSLQAAAGLR